MENKGIIDVKVNRSHVLCRYLLTVIQNEIMTRKLHLQRDTVVLCSTVVLSVLLPPPSPFGSEA